MAGFIERFKERRVERRNTQFAEQILAEVSPAEHELFKMLYGEITKWGVKPILKKALNERNRSLTLFTPAEEGGCVITDKFKIAKGYLGWLNEAQTSILAVAYGKIEGKEGIVLSGGIHQANNLWEGSRRRKIDPSDPDNFWGFIHEYPGRFMYFQDYFAFRVMFEDDGKSLVAKVGKGTEDTTKTIKVRYANPIMNFGSAVHRMFALECGEQILNVWRYGSHPEDPAPRTSPKITLEDSVVEGLLHSSK